MRVELERLAACVHSRDVADILERSLGEG